MSFTVKNLRCLGRAIIRRFPDQNITQETKTKNSRVPMFYRRQVSVMSCSRRQHPGHALRPALLQLYDHAGGQAGKRAGVGARPVLRCQPGRLRRCWLWHGFQAETSGGNPGRSGARIECALDHAPRQLRLGGKLDRLRNPGLPAAFSILSPLLRKVKFPVHQCRALVRAIAEKYADLAVLDAPRRAAILTLHTRRMLTLLQKTRLIDDEYRLPTVQFFHYITAYPVARLICIPARPVQQMLHRIRRRFAHPLGQLPAVLALTAAQQALQIRKAPRTGFRTRKQLRDQPMRPQQLTLPSRQTFLHHSCRRITLQSNPRLSHLSTTVVLGCGHGKVLSIRGCEPGAATSALPARLAAREAFSALSGGCGGCLGSWRHL